MRRDDFPILNTAVDGKPYIYLDNAATTQVPRCVPEAMEVHWFTCNGNVHRGIHTFSRQSTGVLEQARDSVRGFIGAACPEEIIFTSGTTDSINKLAYAFRDTLQPGDEIIATEMEHHSNLIPWQEACKRSGAVFRVAPVLDSGDIDLEALWKMLSKRTKLLAITWVSNVTGAANPVKQIIARAHTRNILVLIDAAQAMRHELVDVCELDCDFLVFSGHKVMGPTGIGVLYGKKEQLLSLPPPSFGGGMVDQVYSDTSTYNKLPFRFEAGTPNYIGAVGLARALCYLEQVGRREIADRENMLLRYCEDALQKHSEIQVLADPKRRVGAISFTVKGVHPTDAAMLLDSLGIAVRSGHHCAQPLLRRLGVNTAIRVSLAFYNTEQEIDKLDEAIRRMLTVLMGR